MVTLWQKFKNPLFPFYNNIFLSPYYKPEAFLDQRFLPKHLYDYFIWPILMNLNSLRVSEIKFLDLRFAILYLGFIVWAVLFIINKLTRNKPGFLHTSNDILFDYRSRNYILSFFILSYILWMVQFSIYRYIIVLELLVPVCFLLVLDRIFISKKVIPIAFSTTIVVGAVFFTPYNWIRIPWAHTYIEVDSTPMHTVHNADIVMLGESPTSYVIPFFPKDNRFLRPESNFLLDYKTGLNDQIYAIIHEDKNPIYLLYDKNDSKVDLLRSATNLNLDLQPIKCLDIQDNMPEELVFCETPSK
jgi:hypothetical protein